MSWPELVWGNLARRRVAGLTLRAILEKLCGVARTDVRPPTAGGREVLPRRRAEPEPDQAPPLAELELELPEQPPPRVLAPRPDPLERRPFDCRC